MRLRRVVVLALTAGASKPAPETTAQRLARVESVAAWLGGGATPPASWVVTSKYDLAARWTPLSAGEQKAVFGATYRDPARRADAAVVVKTATAPRRGTAAEAAKRVVLSDFRGLYLGRIPVDSAPSWTVDHLCTSSRDLDTNIARIDSYKVTLK